MFRETKANVHCDTGILWLCFIFPRLQFEFPSISAGALYLLSHQYRINRERMNTGNENINKKAGISRQYDRLNACDECVRQTNSNAI